MLVDSVCKRRRVGDTGEYFLFISVVVFVVINERQVRNI